MAEKNEQQVSGINPALRQAIPRFPDPADMQPEESRFLGIKISAWKKIGLATITTAIGAAIIHGLARSKPQAENSPPETGNTDPAPTPNPTPDPAAAAATTPAAGAGAPATPAATTNAPAAGANTDTANPGAANTTPPAGAKRPKKPWPSLTKVALGASKFIFKNSGKLLIGFLGFITYTSLATPGTQPNKGTQDTSQRNDHTTDQKKNLSTALVDALKLQKKMQDSVNGIDTHAKTSAKDSTDATIQTPAVDLTKANKALGRMKSGLEAAQKAAADPKLDKTNTTDVDRTQWDLGITDLRNAANKAVTAMSKKLDATEKDRLVKLIIKDDALKGALPAALKNKISALDMGDDEAVQKFVDNNHGQFNIADLVELHPEKFAADGDIMTGMREKFRSSWGSDRSDIGQTFANAAELHEQANQMDEAISNMAPLPNAVAEALFSGTAPQQQAETDTTIADGDSLTTGQNTGVDGEDYNYDHDYDDAFSPDAGNSELMALMKTAFGLERPNLHGLSPQEQISALENYWYSVQPFANKARALHSQLNDDGTEKVTENLGTLILSGLQAAFSTTPEEKELETAAKLFNHADAELVWAQRAACRAKAQIARQYYSSPYTSSGQSRLFYDAAGYENYTFVITEDFNDLLKNQRLRRIDRGFTLSIEDHVNICVTTGKALGLSDEMIAALILKPVSEARLNPNKPLTYEANFSAKNPRSSAEGLYQNIDSNWLRGAKGVIAAGLFPDYKNKSDAQLLGLRYDLVFNYAVNAYNTKAEMKQVTKDLQEITGDSSKEADRSHALLYHMLGMGNGKIFLRGLHQNPNQNAATFVRNHLRVDGYPNGQKILTDNPGVFVGSLQNTLHDYFARMMQVSERTVLGRALAGHTREKDTAVDVAQEYTQTENGQDTPAAQRDLNLAQEAHLYKSLKSNLTGSFTDADGNSLSAQQRLDQLAQSIADSLNAPGDTSITAEYVKSFDPILIDHLATLHAAGLRGGEILNVQDELNSIKATLKEMNSDEKDIEQQQKQKLEEIVSDAKQNPAASVEHGGGNPNWAGRLEKPEFGPNTDSFAQGLLSGFTNQHNSRIV